VPDRRPQGLVKRRKTAETRKKIQIQWRHRVSPANTEATTPSNQMSGELRVRGGGEGEPHRHENSTPAGRGPPDSRGAITGQRNYDIVKKERELESGRRVGETRPIVEKKRGGGDPGSKRRSGKPSEKKVKERGGRF